MDESSTDSAAGTSNRDNAWQRPANPDTSVAGMAMQRPAKPIGSTGDLMAIQRRFFRLCQEGPDSAGSAIDDYQMRGVSVVRSDNTISVLVGTFIVTGRSPHKREVHKEFCAACGNPFGNMLCRLLLDVGLFFEVD